MIKVAVLGYGTVGSGVVEVIESNNEQVSRQAGDEVHVKYILDIRDFPQDPYENLVVHDYGLILNDPEISIVCEVMGGVGAAYEFTRQALEAGKSVCTSNKELVAKHGAELMEIARKRGCSYLFEASVGGGIPLIRPINTALAQEKLQAVTGILNGTTNYILTKMEQEGAAFGQVLKNAQELGYAERNPEADVEGHDACRKIAILSSLITGKNIDSEAIYTEGITGITPADFAYAKAAGMSIKLLATAKVLEDGQLQACVAPFLVSADHPLASVCDVFNGVLVTGNMVGEVMFYGRGAGKLPTASAVVADVIDSARYAGKTSPCFWDSEPGRIAELSQVERSFFVRARKSAKAQVEAALPVERTVAADSREEDLGFFTRPMKEKEFEEIRRQLGDRILGRIRLMSR